MKQYGIAVLGAGMIGAAHASGYRTHQPRFMAQGVDFRLLTVCDMQQESAAKLASTYGFSENATHWQAVLDDDRVNVVSVALPNFEHAKVASAALAAGKHVLCEKPLALTVTDARNLAVQARTTNVTSGIVFNYRRIPAIVEIRDIVQSGEIGTPVHLLIQYQSEYAADPDLPFSWRYAKATAGGGALHDIGAHAIDTARYICGDIDEIYGASMSVTVPTRFFPTETTLGHGHAELSDRSSPVDTDDITSCLMHFTNGCHGVFSTSRVAIGMGNTLSFTLSASQGTLRFSSARPGEFEIARLQDSPQTFSRVVNRPTSPYIGSYVPVPHDGVAIGFSETFGFMIAEFMQAVADGRPFENGSLNDGMKVAEILKAIEICANENRPIRPNHVNS